MLIIIEIFILISSGLIPRCLRRGSLFKILSTNYTDMQALFVEIDLRLTGTLSAVPAPDVPLR